jgi:hypothetical protein
MPTEPRCFAEHILSNNGIGVGSLFGGDVLQAHITWVQN